MSTKYIALIAVACAAVGVALGVVIVDDHPNAQKLTIATMRAQLEEDRKAISPMVAPCMRFLAEVDATHADQAVPK